MVIKVTIKPVSQVQLHYGDCLDVMGSLEPQSIDLILCDLPFGTTDCKGDLPIPLGALWSHYVKVLKPTGCVVLFGNNPFTSELIMSNRTWFKQSLVWNKNKCGSPALAKIRPMQTHEDIVVFAPNTTTYNPQMTFDEPYARQTDNPEGYEGKHNKHGYGMKPVKGFTNHGTRYPKSILNISRDFSAQQQIHPNQKPVPLLEYLIKTYSNVGEWVLDNAMGCGSSLIAARNVGRHVIGIEKEKEYFDLAKVRVTGQP